MSSEAERIDLDDAVVACEHRRERIEPVATVWFHHDEIWTGAEDAIADLVAGDTGDTPIDGGDHVIMIDHAKGTLRPRRLRPR